MLSLAEYGLRSKKITAKLVDPILEVFQIALSTAFEQKRKHPRKDVLLDSLRGDCPQGVSIGTTLFEQGYFAEAVEKGYTVGQVFDEIVTNLRVGV